MSDSTTEPLDLSQVFGPDPITECIQKKIAEAVVELIEGELDGILEAARYARTGARAGYRNGTKPRTVHTSAGSATLSLPRARIRKPEGGTKEWESKILPKYQRRTKSLDAALLGIYLAGGNTRRIKGALKPFLEDAPLSKSVISRLTHRLQVHVENWKNKSLRGVEYPFLYLDATHLKIKLFKKVRSLPILVAMGVRPDGTKEILSMIPLIKESESAWREVLDDLVHRGLSRPILTIVDGHKGLRAAVEGSWPGVAVQRCTTHKVRNLQNHAPKEVYPNVKADYDKIINAENLDAAKKAYDRFCRTWKELPGVVASLREAGEELLTFYRFPKEQWKSLKTTNPIERLNGEFKRRVKTQCSLPSQNSAIILLYGLLLSGQIRFRRINGYQLIGYVMETTKKEKELKKVS